MHWIGTCEIWSSTSGSTTGFLGPINTASSLSLIWRPCFLCTSLFIAFYSGLHLYVPLKMTLLQALVLLFNWQVSSWCCTSVDTADVVWHECGRFRGSTNGRNFFAPSCSLSKWDASQQWSEGTTTHWGIRSHTWWTQMQMLSVRQQKSSRVKWAKEFAHFSPLCYFVSPNSKEIYFWAFNSTNYCFGFFSWQILSWVL